MLTLPQEFLSRMKTDLGDEFESFLASYDKPLTPALRINSLKSTPAAFNSTYDSKFGLTPVPWEENGFYYNESTRPGRSALHEAGLYYIQEASAMIVGAVSDVQPGETVLDLCAAPGGKSSHLASKMNGQGLLVSNEIMPARAKILSRNIERMGITNCVVTNESPDSLADHFPAFFDRIIVDAPCSGEGMFRKEEAAIPNWSLENVSLCASRQKDILTAADRMLKPGGTLVYSTCTFSRDEDEENVAWFLSRHANYEQDDLSSLLGEKLEAWHLSKGFDGRSLRVWPHIADGEGHFCARLHKTAPTAATMSIDELAAELDQESRSSSKKKVRTSGKKGSTKASGNSKREQIKVLQAFWTDSFKTPLPASVKSHLLSFGDDLYLLPAELDLSGLKVLRPGLHLGTLKKGRFEPSHALALSITPDAIKKETGAMLSVSDVRNVFSLTNDSPESLSYLRGESLPSDPSLKGWTIAAIDGYPLGWGKATSGILKNHYPKGLRIQGGY